MLLFAEGELPAPDLLKGIQLQQQRFFSIALLKGKGMQVQQQRSVAITLSKTQNVAEQ